MFLLQADTYVGLIILIVVPSTKCWINVGLSDRRAVCICTNVFI
jgi:hypothetical protein